MIPSARRVVVPALLLLLGLAAGCAPPKPQAVAYGQAAEQPFARDVEVAVSDGFYRDPPRCAVVLPLAGDVRDRMTAHEVESAVAQHLHARLSRVIGPEGRQAAARRLAIDPTHPADQRVLAQALDCPHVVVVRPYGAADVNVIVWSQARLGLELELRRAGEKEALWRARHVATRSEGGLPVSPLSAVGEALFTARFRMDPELAPSLLSDALRRIVATLPDTRSWGVVTG